MPQHRSRTDVALDVSMDPRHEEPRPAPDTPFHIVLLGDFRGRGLRGATASTDEVAARRPTAIDRDNFDPVLGRLAPWIRLRLDERSPELELRFAELDDFHPDRLFERVSIFRSLRDLRRDLNDPSAFRRAAAELRGAGAPGSEPAPAAPPAPVSVPAGLLDEILSGAAEAGPQAAAKPASRPDSELQAYIRSIVAPHLVPGADPLQDELLEQVDEAVTLQMRALLHHADFQALEALWRGLFFLVRRLETGALLRIYVLDVSKAELTADLGADSDLVRSSLRRILVDSSARISGGTPWTLLVACYSLGAEQSDTLLLGRLAGLGRLLGAPVLSAADPRLVGLESFESTPEPEQVRAPDDPAWAGLRASPMAPYLGLALPRFLLRAPYGDDGEACEAFEFEEVSEAASHGEFLWGNPAFLCALLLAEAFQADGWALRPGSSRDLRGLPVHLVRRDAEVAAKPCAEALMTERLASRLLEEGVMPFASLRDQDGVHLVRFQSVADPVRPLAGRWSGA